VVTAPNLDLVTRLETSSVMSSHWNPRFPHRQAKGPSGHTKFPGRPFVCLRSGRVLDGRKAAVPLRTWDEFIDAHPRSHLVVAWLHGTQRIGEVRLARFDLLKRAATAVEPRGDWAITDANSGEIYVAYEDAFDAEQLCTLVRAKPLGPSLQWLSQAAFRLEGEAKRSVEDALKG
jgi:hypothetical protein